MEFLLPGVKVVEVRRRGGHELGSGRFTNASLVPPRTRGGNRVDRDQAAVRSREFDAPAPRVEEMHLLGDTLRIQATKGHASRVERDRGWTNLRPSTDGTIVFSTTNLAAPPVRVRLIEGEQPARASASAPPQPSPQRPTPPVDALGPRPPTIAPAAAPPALPMRRAGSGRCPSPSVGSRQRSYWPSCCSAFPTPPGPSNSVLWSASGGRRCSDCGGWVLSHGCCAPDPLARSPCHFLFPSRAAQQ